MVLNQFFYFKVFLFRKFLFTIRFIYMVHIKIKTNILNINLKNKEKWFYSFPSFFSWCSNFLQIISKVMLNQLLKLFFYLNREIFIDTNINKITNKNSLTKFGNLVTWYNNKKGGSSVTVVRWCPFHIMPYWIKIKHIKAKLIFQIGFEGFIKIINLYSCFCIGMVMLIFKLTFVFKKSFF